MPVCFLNLKLQEVIFNAEGIQVAQHFTKCWHVQYICMAYMHFIQLTAHIAKTLVLVLIHVVSIRLYIKCSSLAIYQA